MRSRMEWDGIVDVIALAANRTARLLLNIISRCDVT